MESGRYGQDKQAELHRILHRLDEPSTTTTATRGGRGGKNQRGGGKRAATSTPKEELSLCERPYFSTLQTLSGSPDLLLAAKEDGRIGWDPQQIPSELSEISKDGLTVFNTGTGFGGAVGLQLYSYGCHSFAIRVIEPVDDAFWVGVAYADTWVSQNPKENTKIIAWSGGNARTNRPGTVRVHGEKMRNQPRYSTGDVIGVTVDMSKGDLFFFLNAEKVIEWRGVLQGPVYPYVSIKHPNGPAATILQHWNVEEENEEEDENALGFRDVVGGSEVGALPDVNGSLLEGGGQVLRISLGFCALLGKPMRIHSIRAGRTNPGLGHQHSTGAKLVTDLCGGMVRPKVIQYGGHAEGVTELQVWPGVEGLRGGTFIADPHTAGSITLLLQASLPCCLLGQRKGEDVRLALRGGSNTKGAPSIDFINLCLFPVLVKHFGVPKENLSMIIKKRGYYPLGGAEVDFLFRPVSSLTPICLLERGNPVNISGSVFGGGTGKKIAKDVQRLVKQKLTELFPSANVSISLSEEPDGGTDKKPETSGGTHTTTTSTKDDAATPTFKERRAMAEEKRRKNAGVCGCQIVMETDTGCFLTGDALILEAGKTGSVAISPSEVADKAIKRLVEAWEDGKGCVDEYLMDQLVIFMALAKGRSKVLCPAPTSISSLHLETAIHFSELLCGVKFEVTTQEDGTKIVECEGLAFGS